MVEGDSLENCCTAMYRGFESLLLRMLSGLAFIPERRLSNISVDFLKFFYTKAIASAHLTLTSIK